MEFPIRRTKVTKRKEMERRNGQEGQDYATTSPHTHARAAPVAVGFGYGFGYSFVFHFGSERSFGAESAAQSAAPNPNLRYLEITPNVWVFGCHASVGQTVSPLEIQDSEERFKNLGQAPRSLVSWHRNIISFSEADALTI